MKRALRLAASAIWTGIAGFLALIGGLLRPFSRRLSLRLGSLAGHLWGKGLCVILGIRVSIKGALPPPGTVVVANHWSWLDIPVLFSAFPGCFISKHEIAGWFGFGILAKGGGTLFVVRGNRSGARRTVQDMGKWLQAGARVVFFPEGRAWNGLEILPFKSTLFRAPVDLQASCVPVGLAYDSRKAAWDDDSTFAKHFTAFAATKGCNALVTVGEPIPSDVDRKELAATLRGKVAALSGLPEAENSEPTA